MIRKSYAHSRIRGVSKAHNTTVRKIADAVGVDPHDLLADDGRLVFPKN